MNQTLRAVIVELTGSNVRNHHINLHGAFGLFPEDCLGGRSKLSAEKPITLEIGAETVETDIDATKAIFRERSAIRRFFDSAAVNSGDLVLIERLGKRSYRVSKASKRGLKYYL